MRICRLPALPFRKYAVFNTAAAGGGADHSFAVPLMRSADIYLLVAEALIRTTRCGRWRRVD
jgi:hypothetical protein